MIQVLIPSYGNIVRDSGRSYTVFHIEVIVSGQCHKLEKRYSDFHALHKKFKKIMKTPSFPPKKVRNWDNRVLEQRRQALEVYIQGILKSNDVPQHLLSFLGLSCLSTSANSDYAVVENDIEEMSHQPILSFEKDAFLWSDSPDSDFYSLLSTDSLPDIVVNGVLAGFYQ